MLFCYKIKPNGSQDRVIIGQPIDKKIFSVNTKKNNDYKVKNTNFKSFGYAIAEGQFRDEGKSLIVSAPNSFEGSNRGFVYIYHDFNPSSSKQPDLKVFGLIQPSQRL